MPRSKSEIFGTVLDIRTHVLLALEGEKRYGGELKTILAAGPRLDHFAPPRKPSNSTLYPALRNLEDEGFLSAETQRDPGRKGPPRVYYSLTGKGIRLVNAIKSTYADLAAGRLCPGADDQREPESFPVAARHAHPQPVPTSA